uniref:Uncharacterized protein LOC104223615 n=1 Tax=Nicotiana sylvestris TaxID=4096 RepID=A0A1U7W046_NICSY|nr:PREDICTED: uncharacterized protein LOC104223615 [Nicotiana sylvestris]
MPLGQGLQAPVSRGIGRIVASSSSGPQNRVYALAGLQDQELSLDVITELEFIKPFEVSTPVGDLVIARQIKDSLVPISREPALEWKGSTTSPRDSGDTRVTIQDTATSSLVTEVRERQYGDPLVDDWVFLKVSPMKGIIRFGKKGKLSPRYIGPYKIIRIVGQVAYELDLPSILESVHPVLLRKCIRDPSRFILIDDVPVTDQLSYEEAPIAILDRLVRRLRTKDVSSVKVLWRNNNEDEMTWEAEEYMNSRYPHLFPLSEEDRTETSQSLGTYMVDNGTIKEETLSKFL